MIRLHVLNYKVIRTLNLGTHRLQFISAPMVHWPEVIMTYDAKDKILCEKIIHKGIDTVVVGAAGQNQFTITEGVLQCF